MEDDLFDFESCELVGSIFQYEGVTLKIKIGEYEAGTTFYYVQLDILNNQIYFLDDDNEVESTFKVKLVIDEEVHG